MRPASTILFAFGLSLACQGSARLRVDEPARSTLTIRGRGDGSGVVSLPVPFVAELDAAGGSFGYPVTLELPADVAVGYGGSDALVIAGELYLYSGRELAQLEIPGGRLFSLVRQQETVVECEARDDDGSLRARLVLHGATR